MTGLEPEPPEVHQKNGYFLSASLVNKLIVAIIMAIITVGGYMIVWALNDARWKTEQEGHVDKIVLKMNNIDSKLMQLPPPWLLNEVELHRSEIRDLRNKVTKLETEHASGMNGKGK